MKLAEIAFKEFDYKKSEEHVDSIIYRAAGLNYNGLYMEEQKNATIFAHILKSFFLSLRGEYQRSEELLAAARKLKPDATFLSLEVIRDQARISNENIQIRDIVVLANESES